MAQTKNLVRPFGLGDLIGVPVKASTKIYQGAAVGLVAGYARAIAITDRFAGFCEALADNSAVATDGAINAQVRVRGIVELPVTSAAVTDIGKPVYATDSETFDLTSDTYPVVGRIVQFVSTGIVQVAFDAGNAGTTGVAILTGTLTGTANGSLADVAAAAGACAGGSTPTATQVDTAIATAVATIVSGTNTQLKELQTKVNEMIKLTN